MNPHTTTALALAGLALLSVGSAPARSDEATAAVAVAPVTSAVTAPGTDALPVPAPAAVAAGLPVPSGPPQRLGPRRKLQTAITDPSQSEIRPHTDETNSAPK